MKNKKKTVETDEPKTELTEEQAAAVVGGRAPSGEVMKRYADLVAGVAAAVIVQGGVEVDIAEPGKALDRDVMVAITGIDRKAQVGEDRLKELEAGNHITLNNSDCRRTADIF